MKMVLDVEIEELENKLEKLKSTRDSKNMEISDKLGSCCTIMNCFCEGLKCSKCPLNNAINWNKLLDRVHDA